MLSRAASSSFIERFRSVACALAFACVQFAAAQTPLGSSISYQGGLVDSGSPANASYDFIFTLHDDEAAGSLVAGPLSVDGVAVAEGLFTVELDFGSGAFDGNRRWLEIQVSPAGAGTYETLSPRQELTPAAYALYAVEAGSVAGFDPASAWNLAGNAGTADGTDFLGTTDDTALDIRVNGSRALRIEPAIDDNGAGEFAPNIVANSSLNIVGDGAAGAFIVGGDPDLFGTAYPHEVYDDYSVALGGVGNVVGSNDGDPASAILSAAIAGLGNTASNTASAVLGGQVNTAGGNSAAVVGGQVNAASNVTSAVLGGQVNTASGNSSAVVGGAVNEASGNSAAVVGGQSNTASGGNAVVIGGNASEASADNAAVMGGILNQAGGQFSFAAGHRAIVRDATASGDSNGDEGTFVWADSTSADFESTGPNQFLARASGGMGVNTNAPTADLTVNGEFVSGDAGSNAAGGSNAAAIGGFSNTASGGGAAVVGGAANTASDIASVVVGGQSSTASGNGAAVVGGSGNEASGDDSVVAGGANNEASGTYSLAAGRRAGALHQGAFVWADSTNADFDSTAANQFLIRASGGVGINDADPASALEVNGTVTATAFAGDGSALTNLPSSGWSLAGNAGTTDGTDFLGTTDDTAFNIRVNDSRALRVEPAIDSNGAGNAAPNVITGDPSGSVVGDGAAGVFVIGGDPDFNSTGTAFPNEVYDDYSVVVGGFLNVAGSNDGNPTSDRASAVIGGVDNTASGSEAVVLGGSGNVASGGGAAILGGFNHTASNSEAVVIGGAASEASGFRSVVIGALAATASGSEAVILGGRSGESSGFASLVLGGSDNIASGDVSVAIGGDSNQAGGESSFAAGVEAEALTDNTFVWSDGTSSPFTSQTANTFLIEAANGVGINTNNPASELDVNGTVTATAFSGDGSALTGVFSREGDAFVIVQTTASAATNGTNLLAAYAAASALTPNGSALSADNRAALLVPPGSYDLGTASLTLDTEFVDLIGLSSNPRNQYIFGESGGAGTGVLMQTASNVAIENLRVECTRSSGGLSNNDTDPAAYFPSSNRANAVVRNCVFEANDTHAFSMRTHITYSGTFEDVEAGDRAFGGGMGDITDNSAGTASGTFIRCSGGEAAFAGALELIGRGVASGTFIDCSGGDYSFAGNQFSSMGGTASGTFTNCSAGINSFAGGDTGGTASGTFTNCSAGNNSFAGGLGVGGEASGTFTNCSAGDNSFAGAFNGGIASGTFSDCSAGDSSFAGGESSGGGASGTFSDCSAGDSSFAGGKSSGGGASGTFSDCSAGDNSFAGSDDIGGTASGTFNNCSAGDYSFGGGVFLGGTATGTFNNCSAGDYSFGSGPIFDGSAPGGRFRFCEGGLGSFTENNGGGANPVHLFCIQDGAQYSGND